MPKQQNVSELFWNIQPICRSILLGLKMVWVLVEFFYDLILECTVYRGIITHSSLNMQILSDIDLSMLGCFNDFKDNKYPFVVICRPFHNPGYFGMVCRNGKSRSKARFCKHSKLLLMCPTMLQVLYLYWFKSHSTSPHTTGSMQGKIFMGYIHFFDW